MQLILETETAADIETMTDIKENIKEKLVNGIIENFNLKSSDKGNVELQDNVVSNGLETENKVIDDGDPVVEVCKEITNQQDVNNVKSDNEQDNIESSVTQNQIVESISNNNSEEKAVECIDQLKYVLKQEIDDVIMQEQFDDTSISVPKKDDKENNDNDVHMEEVKEDNVTECEKQSDENTETKKIEESIDMQDTEEIKEDTIDIQEMEEIKGSSSDMDIIKITEKIKEDSIDSKDTNKINEDSIVIKETEKINEESTDIKETEIINGDSIDTKDTEIIKEDSVDTKDKEKINEGSLDQKDTEKIKEVSIDTNDMDKIKEDSIDTKDMEKIKEDSIDTKYSKKIKDDFIDTKDTEIINEDSINTEDMEKINDASIDTNDTETLKEDSIDTKNMEKINEVSIHAKDTEKIKEDSVDTQDKKEIKESDTDVIEILNETEHANGPKESNDVPINDNEINTEKDSVKPKDVEPLVYEIKIDDNVKENDVSSMEAMEIDANDKDDTFTAIDYDEVPEISEISTAVVTNIESKDEVMVVEEEIKELPPENQASSDTLKEKELEKPVAKKNPAICKLSNTLNILSDDEDEAPKEGPPEEDPPKENPLKEHEKVENPVEKQCINIEDDDDIMLIEEDSMPKDSLIKKSDEVNEAISVNGNKSNVDEETGEKSSFMESIELVSNKNDKETTPPAAVSDSKEIQVGEKTEGPLVEKVATEKPLLAENVLSLTKKKLADMTREDLEEFCILKIVESIMDRSQLSDIKAKLKTMTQQLDETRKKAMMLTKQNRDLQVVLKSVQKEQKKINETYNVITPLKITRSVGMQVLMTDKAGVKRKSTAAPQNTPRQTRVSPAQTPRPQKPNNTNQAIPVPRLVPASNTGTLRNSTNAVANTTSNVGKSPTPVANGMRNSPPVQKVAEKRPLNRTQSVTVDLTDDEPPAKITQRSSPAPPVRVVPQQSLMASPRQQSTLSQMINSPRKVFIPITGQTGQNLRPGQTIMLKTIPQGSGPRPRAPGTGNVTRAPQNQARVRPTSLNRHPAPLPDAMKQYQPPNWKALPPAPDLKLSKVENGIVISWKIDGYQEDSYEQIASYQLYAYQETSSPPSTALWKKIGDVKALPLPMACTLTQFMAGFKYYFAVRAVDVRSRLGPFSLPGSILLLNKM